MKNKHPIIAVTGASGAGTTVVQEAFKQIFYRQGINAAFVRGDSFFKFEQDELCQQMDAALHDGEKISCYGPELNNFDLLESLFKEYSEKGSGNIRQLVNSEDTDLLQQPVGTFTDWEPIADGTDLLFYEGLHGGVVAQSWTRRKNSESGKAYKNDRRDNRKNQGVNVAKYVDLLIGVVPAINLEWIQKAHHDMACREVSRDDVNETILQCLQDYIHYIVPQFSLTDINFQRMPVVDTSNPFIARDVPKESESVVVIHFRHPERFNFTFLLKRIHGSFMSRRNTMVIPGGEMQHALDVICAPIIEDCCGMRLRD